MDAAPANTVTPAALVVELVPIDNVHEHPRNPRKGSVEAIRESLRNHEQYLPIAVQRSTGFAVRGNHTLKAARAEGYTHINVVYRDVDDDEALRILLNDNWTSDQGTYDQAELADLLASLGGDFTGVGYGQSDLDAMLAALNPPPAGEDDPSHWSEPSTGSVLSVNDVSLGQPRHEVHLGDIFRLGPCPNEGDAGPRVSGPHHLCVVSVATGWPLFAPLLEPDVLLLPYPGIYLPLTKRLLAGRAVFVQPDRYLAGHLLDKWGAMFGDGTIVKVSQ